MSAGNRYIHCLHCEQSKRHGGRGLCTTCYWWHWKHGELARFPETAVRSADSWRAAFDPERVDHAAVERILGGDWRLKIYDPNTKVEVCRRWVSSGRSLRQLELLTGWATHRYFRVGEMAS